VIDSSACTGHLATGKTPDGSTPGNGANAAGRSLSLPRPWASAKRPWGTRAQLSAIGARSRAGIRDCQGQDRALNSADVGAVLEHLRREVPGRLVSIWDGAPSPRRPLLPDCLAKGAAERVPVARRPAYAPALNPPEGVWAYLQGVERRKGCGVDLPPRRRDLGDAVQRVCRPWRVIAGFFRGAKLSFFMHGSVGALA
jgi:DDE superfamily endonuclease